MYVLCIYVHIDVCIYIVHVCTAYLYIWAMINGRRAAYACTSSAPPAHPQVAPFPRRPRSIFGGRPARQALFFFSRFFFFFPFFRFFSQERSCSSSFSMQFCLVGDCCFGSRPHSSSAQAEAAPASTCSISESPACGRDPRIRLLQGCSHIPLPPLRTPVDQILGALPR